MPFKGRFNPKTSTIEIRDNLDLKQSVTTILFELCNANNPELMRKKIRYDLFSNAHKYAIYMESAEHNSYKQAAKLYIDIINGTKDINLIPIESELDEFIKLLDFNNAMKSVQDNHHYQYYVKAYQAALPLKLTFFSPEKTLNTLSTSTKTTDKDATETSNLILG